MARIRTIKPDFWTDGKVVSISPYARLLFIGMWNFAICDKGHVADDAMKLKLQILPIDNVDIEELLSELLDHGLVKRVGVPGTKRTFLHVNRMEEHQKTDARWTPRCPMCTPSNSPELTETHASITETHRDSPELTPVKERKGKEKDMRIDKPMRVIDSDFEAWWKHYPRKIARGQAEKAYRVARKIADADTLIAAVQAYSKSVADKDATFIAYGSTWLNGKRWLDEGVAPVTAASIEEWLRECWTNANTKLIEDRCGMEFPMPDIPDELTGRDEIREYVATTRRDWIKTNHDEIVRRITQREVA